MLLFIQQSMCYPRISAMLRQMTAMVHCGNANLSMTYYWTGTSFFFTPGPGLAIWPGSKALSFYKSKFLPSQREICLAQQCSSLAGPPSPATGPDGIRSDLRPGPSMPPGSAAPGWQTASVYIILITLYLGLNSTLNMCNRCAFLFLLTQSRLL